MARRKVRYIPPVPKINLFALITRTIWTSLVIGIIAVILLNVLQKPDRPKQANLVVNEIHCKIPELTSMPILKTKKKLKMCETKGYLTKIVSTPNEDDSLSVSFVSDALQKGYGISLSDIKNIKCCYRIIERVPGNDSAVHISDTCVEFQAGEEINEFEIDKNIQTIAVECSKDGKVFYENAHSIIAHKTNLKKRQIEKKVKATKPYSVVIFGIDGMSRMNLKRGMPDVHKLILNQSVVDPGWIEMKGFTRISNESFSNVFAILTGKSPTEDYGKCKPRSNSYLDDCKFIWEDYENTGYVTTYAEDQAANATFNRRHKGFKKQPTDHYFRPFLLAAEKKLKAHLEDGLISCLGSLFYIDHIFMQAAKMGEIHKHAPNFGVFYINSLRTKRLSAAKAMNNRVAGQFAKIAGYDTFDDSFVILFGDKGLRFDEYSPGFYEERLPLLYIRVPPKFRKKYPEFVTNLRINSQRLTSPYDLFITLRHIINLTAKKKVDLSAEGCSSCRSLFYEVQPERRCSDVSIPDNECPCSLIPLRNDREVLKLAAQHATQTLNQNLMKMKSEDGQSCASLKLINVTSGSQQLTTPWNMNYLVQFRVSPTNAKFEVLLRRKFSTIVSLTPQFEVLQQIVHMSEINETKLCVPKSNSTIKMPKSMNDEADDFKRIEQDGVYYDGYEKL